MMDYLERIYSPYTFATQLRSDPTDLAFERGRTRPGFYGMSSGPSLALRLPLVVVEATWRGTRSSSLRKRSVLARWVTSK